MYDVHKIQLYVNCPRYILHYNIRPAKSPEVGRVTFRSFELLFRACSLARHSNCSFSKGHVSQPEHSNNSHSDVHNFGCSSRKKSVSAKCIFRVLFVCRIPTHSASAPSKGGIEFLAFSDENAIYIPRRWSFHYPKAIFGQISFEFGTNK